MKPIKPGDEIDYYFDDAASDGGHVYCLRKRGDSLELLRDGKSVKATVREGASEEVWKEKGKLFQDKVLRVLEYLLCLEGKSVEKEEIWKEFNCDVDVYLSRIRALLNDNGRERFIMRTGTGTVRFVSDVRGQPPSPHWDPPSGADTPTHPYSYGLPEQGLVVGRDDEIARAMGSWMADRRRPVLIWGSPGIGKSTLALALLHHPEIIQKFGTHRYRLRCDGSESAAAMKMSMGRDWFGLNPSSRIESDIIDQLSEQPVACVIDNFETPHKEDPVASEEWLKILLGIETVWLIVTTQGYHLPAGIEWNDRIEPTSLSAANGRELFVGITKEERHAQDPRLGGLLADLGGIPHAIELMAHQAVNAPDLGPLLTRWAEEGVPLLQRSTGQLRETSLVISYNFAFTSKLLTDAGRSLLRILACLPAGVCEMDIPKIAPNLDGVPPRKAADTLARSALAYRESGRLRLLAPVRDFVLRIHAPSAHETRTARDHFSAMARKGWKVGDTGGKAAFALLTEEYANVEWAVRNNLEAGDRQAIVAAMALSDFSTGSYLRDDHLLHRALSLASGDRFMEALCIGRIAKVAFSRGQYEEARTLFKEALETYHSLHHGLSVAETCQWLGIIANQMANYDEARAFQLKAIEAYRVLGGPKGLRGVAYSTMCLGKIAASQGNTEEARARIGEASALFGDIGNTAGIAVCDGDLLDLAMNSGLCDEETRIQCERALEFYSSIGWKGKEGACLSYLGRIAFQRGDYHEAAVRYEEALAMFRAAGHRNGEAEALFELGRIAREERQFELAKVRFETALPVARATGDKTREVLCLIELGTSALEMGTPDEAVHHFTMGLAVSRSIGYLDGEGICLTRLCVIALNNREFDKAESYAQGALKINEMIGGEEAHKAVGLRILGQISYHVRGDRYDAHEKFAAALPIFVRCGDHHGIAISAIALGEIAFELRQDAEAARMFNTALEAYRLMGREPGETYCLQMLGEIARRASSDRATKDELR